MKKYAQRAQRTRLGAALLIVLCAGTIIGCKAEKPAEKLTLDSTAATRSFHPEWSKNSVIYEVNIRQYTPEGTFAAFTKQLPRIRALGVDILWLMPVQPIGKIDRKGSLGSYYSIANYHEFNPEFGNKADFVALVDAAHQQGMKVILDWVANHTAFDHHWATEHKDYYTLKTDGSISRAIDDKGKETDWSDVADLNYGNSAMRSAMMDEMQWWLDNTPIDGFRCDVAGFVPYDFWREVSDKFRAKRPDIFMLAEWEDPKLHASFDMTYGWELFHLMNDIASGKKGTDELPKFFAAQQAAYGDSAYRMNFTSNHDENSWNGTEFERMGANHLAAYVLSATVQNSMPLLYTGQEASLKKRLRFFDKDTVDWTGSSLAPFYTRLFELRHQEAALWNGPWGGPQTEITTNGDNKTFAFARVRDSSAVAIFVNFGDKPVTLAYSDFKTPGPYIDWFTNAAVKLDAVGTVTVSAHGSRVLVRKPMTTVGGASGD